MPIPFINKSKSYSIVLIIFFATSGYTITDYIINKNLIQYTILKGHTIDFKVHDGGAKSDSDSIILNAPIISKYAIDTLSDIKGVLQGNVTERNILFHENPIFPIWGMLFLIMITLASGSVPLFIGQIIQLKTNFDLNNMSVFLAVIFSVFIIIFLTVASSYANGHYNPTKIVSDFHILFKKGEILQYLVRATILLILPVFVTMFLIGPSSDKLLEQKITKENLEKITIGLNFLNQILLNSLQLLSVIVVFTVLTTSMLGQTIKGVLEIKGYDIFPSEISYAYGMFFSLFLCVLYIPTYGYLKQQYIYLQSLVIITDDLKEEKENLINSVNFKSSAIDNLKTALTILAPFISSFLPENLHLLK